jgi:DNA polymerase-3 subunit epsilon
MVEQFDMFSEGAGEARPISRDRTISAVPGPQSNAVSEDGMVRHLSQTGRYRILKKLEPRAVATVVRPQYRLNGIIIDTETTGLSAGKDEIIEIGVIAFTFDGSGCVGDVTGIYGGLRQPGVSISPEITKLTGITNEMVAGQSIEIAALHALIGPADLVIAHNASFDRPFCEAFSPLFDRKAWACSNSEIDWSAHGYEGTRLGYLIGQAGYFHEGHRAVDDCFALLEVLDRKVDGSGSSAFSELYEASQRSLVRIFAENSPFDMKDHLKARGYRCPTVATVA